MTDSLLRRILNMRGFVMTVKLELRPEVQVSLLAAAQALGLSLEAYLDQVLQQHTVSPPVVSGEEWEKAFDAWIVSFPASTLLSDADIARESMYPDRW